MGNSPYYLSKHTFFCLAGDHYVFLDLRSDEYLCLGRMHSDAVKDLLNGDQAVDDRSPGSRLQDANNSEANAVVHALLNKGLLVEKKAYGRLPRQPRVDTPSASAMESSAKLRPEIGPAHVWNFFVASATASKDLRWRSIERIVRKVASRKSAHMTPATTVNSGAVTGLFKIFQTLRPYYPRPYLCMFDSLALVHFLARYGVFPQWVYGVQLEPFQAHCWVQVGDLVVNDIVDTVRNYTPIMSV